MKIIIKSYGALRHYIGKKDEIDVEKGSSIEKIINVLIVKFGKDVKECIISNDGNYIVKFIIDGYIRPSDFKVTKKTEIKLLPPMAGG